MRCSVFIATSADGFIASADGGVDWLDTVGKPEADLGDKADMGFFALMAAVDCMIMGRKSMEKLSSFNLTPEQWPYGETPIYVLSRSLTEAPENLKDRVQLFNGEVPQLLRELEAQGLQHAYVDGGMAITEFLRLELIDELCVTLAPVILGSGIPLFGALPKQIELEQAEAEAFANEFIQIRYKLKYS